MTVGLSTSQPSVCDSVYYCASCSILSMHCICNYCDRIIKELTCILTVCFEILTGLTLVNECGSL